MFFSYVLDDVSDRLFHADDELYSRSISRGETQDCIMTDYRRLIDASLFA